MKRAVFLILSASLTGCASMPSGLQGVAGGLADTFNRQILGGIVVSERGIDQFLPTEAVQKRDAQVVEITKKIGKVIKKLEADNPDSQVKAVVYASNEADATWLSGIIADELGGQLLNKIFLGRNGSAQVPDPRITVELIAKGGSAE